MRTTRPRLGYTLLEVILATSISLVLLAALFATLKLHLTTAAWGPAAAERAQTSRAIVGQLRRDIAHLVIPVESNVTSTFTRTGDGRLSITRYAGVRGGERWVEFFVDDSIVAADRDVTTRVGISRVRYEVTRTRGRRLEYEERDGWSLKRIRVPAEYAESWDRGQLDADTWTLTSEMTRGLIDMRFAYWDGESWRPDWTIAASEQLPMAIRVEFILHKLTPQGGRGDGAQSVVIHLADANLLKRRAASEERVFGRQAPGETLQTSRRFGFVN